MIMGQYIYDSTKLFDMCFIPPLASCEMNKNVSLQLHIHSEKFCSCLCLSISYKNFKYCGTNMKVFEEKRNKQIITTYLKKKFCVRWTQTSWKS